MWIFRYSRSIFCLPHQLNFSDIFDIFDLCLHWVSVVRGLNFSEIANLLWILKTLRLTFLTPSSISRRESKLFQVRSESFYQVLRWDWNSMLKIVKAKTQAFPILAKTIHTWCMQATEKKLKIFYVGHMRYSCLSVLKSHRWAG